MTTQAPPSLVVPIHAGMTVTRDRKAEFLNHLAQCFDSYTARNGYEPDASVFVLCGLKQTADCYWSIRGDSEGGGTTILALAQTAISKEIINPSGEG